MGYMLNKRAAIFACVQFTIMTVLSIIFAVVFSTPEFFLVAFMVPIGAYLGYAQALEDERQRRVIEWPALDK